MPKDDFIKELGYLGITTRFKRLSDMLMHDGKKMYSALKIDIEPNWFVVFKLLKARGPLGVTEIADHIGMAHPSVITLVNKMIASGYLNSGKDEKDSRKRVLGLSNKALTKLPEYEKIWKMGEKVMAELLEENNTLEVIASLEEKLFAKGFKERMLEELNA